MGHARRAKRPLDPEATRAADEALAAQTGGRPLTNSPEDTALRSQWMDAYVAAGGELEGEDWGDDAPDDAAQGCPLEGGGDEDTEETYEWYFSS